LRQGLSEAVSSRGFHGWRIVAVAMLAQLAAVGCTSSIYGLYVEPVSDEFGASRMSIGLGLTLIFLVSAVLAPAIGYWLDKGSIRNIMTLGGLLLASGLTLLGSAAELWQMMLIIAFLLGAGFTTLGPLPSNKVVTNWFMQKRGRALGIAAMGTSLGGFLLPPIAALLIREVGWRGSLSILGGAVALVILPTVWTVIVNRPEEIGQTLDGAAAVDSDAAGGVEGRADAAALSEAAEISMGQVARNRSFWGIGLAVAFLSTAGIMFITHFPAHASELKIEATTAALVLSCNAGAGVAGKLVYGFLADRIDKRLLLWSVSAVAGGAWLLFLDSTTVPRMLVVGFVLGFGAGGTLPLWNALIGSCFGRQALGRVMGLMGLILLPFVMIAPPLGGYVFDQTGSYVPAFQGTLALFALAALATWLIKVPEREPGT
jgi:sugar phosphate permease